MERTERKKILGKALQVVFPLMLGAFILVWVYRDFKFDRVWDVLCNGMDYGWMLFSLVFGVSACIFRALRWKLALEPLGEFPKTANCVYAIFLSYASSLVIPRVGEVLRCGVLSKYDGVSFSKSLGTVVSERMVDTLCMGGIVALTLLLKVSAFAAFFEETGTNIAHYAHVLTSGHFYLFLVCALAIFILLLFLVRNVALFAKLKGILANIWKGMIALKDVRNIPLYITYSLCIWLSYFLEFYVAFHAFSFSADLGVMTALVMFVVGTLAVLVPTPNGAGPWHFAIMTMMMIYGVGKEDAGIFALLVHGIQTFLLILLGIYGLSALPLTNKK